MEIGSPFSRQRGGGLACVEADGSLVGSKEQSRGLVDEILCGGGAGTLAGASVPGKGPLV